jgi:CBS domain-containing protein
MHWAEGDSPRPQSHWKDDSLFTAWQNPELKELPHDEVRDYMTADPVTVVSDTPLARMAELMMEAHVHRLIVVDAESHPVGVVTTTDILAALIREARKTT